MRPYSRLMLVLALLLGAVPGIAYAETVFSEDFTDNDNVTDDLQLMSEFSVSSTGANADWHIFEFGGDQFARCNGFGADTASDDWLFTPVMNLTGATTAAVKFESAYNFTGPTLELKVSTNYTPGNAPSTATWTDLSFTEPGAGGYVWAGSGDVNLTAHISATTVVAWRYTTTGTGSGQSRVWEVDDIVVFTNGVVTAVEGEGEGVAEGEGEGAAEGEGEGSSEGESIGEGGVIISEYIEGTSNNKAVEIFNGKTTAESLTGYSLVLFSNGASTATVEVPLTDFAASLPARGTLVIANSAANASILAAADGTCAFPTCPITYNGDDAVALYKDGVPVDVVGEIGVDPGAEWSDAGLSTLNQTLRRKNFVCFGNPDGFNPVSTLSAEWNTFAVDTFSGLGSHSIDCTGSPEGEQEGEGEGASEGEGEGEGEEVECNEVFAEDFEDNFNSTTNNDLDNFQLMTRVSVASAGNEANWHIFGAGDEQFARINGFGADVASDDWLITPAMNLVGFEDAILTFDSAYNFGGPALEVKVSTNYNAAIHANPASATWTNLSPTLPTVGGYVFANSGDVSLAGHLGASTYVAFRYVSNGTAGGDGRVWEVDNVAVCGVPEGPEPPQYFSSITAEIGDNVCMTVPLPGSATDGDFSWTFTPVGGSPQAISGQTGITYCRNAVMTTDSGAYRATYEDGSKAVVTYTFFLTVVESLPVGGGLGLGLAAAAVAAMGALGLRRRSR
ncbi:MAG: hypothetical protein RLZZ303_1421 [Candidatus Hydrogenedentota bacterium]